MRFNEDEGCALTGVDGQPSRVGDASQSSTGRGTFRSVTTQEVQRDLTRLRVDFNRLKLRLREISPSDPMFQETFMTDDPLESSSLSSTASTDLKSLLKVTKTGILRLRSRIGEIEQGLPRLSGSAAPPPADGERGEAQEV